MLAAHDSDNRFRVALNRRECLRVGGLGFAGLTLPQLWEGWTSANESAVLASFGRARSCIVVFLFGAPAHQDMWDLKPAAPAEYRGEFGPIATSVPGIQVGEHLPRLAQQARRFAIVRSFSHPDNTHTVAMHFMLTGVRHAQPATNPRNQPGDFPTYGAVLNYVRRGRASLPAGISLNAPANQVSANNHIFPGFFAGMIGSTYDPFFIPDDPSQADFQPFPTMADTSGVRQRLLGEVDRSTPVLAGARPVREFGHYYQRAFDVVTSPGARRAFDLSQENPSVRDRYGRTPFGQGLLLARRLVEAGVPLITVNWARNDAYWDTHARNFELLKDSLLPPFDLGFSALLEDLDQRGLLEDTLVVCLGEFGRTPTINRNAGRDHWAACNSVVLAGGGVRGGQVLGASDRIAAYPTTPPVTPADLAATIYHALGVPLETELRDPLGRPLALCTGRPITELF